MNLDDDHFYDHIESDELAQMEIDGLNEEIFFLKVLAVGCEKHRAYRALRNSRVNCKRCDYMYEVRSGLCI